MKYFERNLLVEIKKWIDRREIIAIKGPRQGGKTTLLEMLKEWLIKEKGIDGEDIVFITFEDREILERFSINPMEFVRRYIKDKRTYFFIDEAHYCIDIGQKLKLLYDTFKNARFIITGSSSLELTSETARYLVGRLFSFELLPFDFYEFLNAKDRGLAKIYSEINKKIKDFISGGIDFNYEKDIFVTELLRYLEEYLIFGGYPEVVKAKIEEEKRIILKNIFNTYLEKDIAAFLQISDTIKLRKLVSTLAFETGGIVKYESLITGCGSYFKEITSLLNVLEHTYIIRPLRPFYRNLVTELRKNPKFYFIDTGTRNYAVRNFNPMDEREDAGKLAECFVFNEISKLEEFSINYWRTTAKAEVDFVLSDINRVIPIEVKFQEFRKPKITRSFSSFLKAYKPDRAIVVTKNFWGEKTLRGTKLKFIPIVYF